MLTHHLASSPSWPPHRRYRSESSQIEDRDVERNETMVDDFEGPGENNEVCFLKHIGTYINFIGYSGMLSQVA